MTVSGKYDIIIYMSKLIYKSPAENFETAFPIGNGRIGAKVYGNPNHEVLKINEESLWSKPFYNRNNPQSLKANKEINTLISQERWEEAQDLVYECLSATPTEQASYCPSGEIHIDFYDTEHSKSSSFEKIDSYKREIDFDTGIVSSEFSIESSISGEKDFSKNSADSSITYTRECFASCNGNVLVYHISSSVPKSIYLRASIVKPGCAKKYPLTNDTLSVLDINGFPSCIMMTAISSDGTICTKGEYLIVEKSDDVTLYINVESGYRSRHFRIKQGDVHKKPLAIALKCADIALKRICFASGTSYENLKKEFIADYASWNTQAKLLIDGKPDTTWDFAKYKLLCDIQTQSTLPKIKKGLWTEKEGNRFNLLDNSLYRYSAGMVGLSRLNKPFFDFTKRLYKHGKMTAESMYGIEGFVCHNSTDIWGDTSPCGTNFSTSYSPFGALSFANALIEYYEYTLDKKFLKKHFSIIKFSSKFFLTRLSLVDEKKHLVLSPSFTDGWNTSEGKTIFIAKYSKKDSLAIKKLFENTLKIMKYLSISHNSFSFDLQNAIEKLDIQDSKEINSTINNIDFFDEWLTNAKNSILKCRMKKERIELTLLESVPNNWENGSLKKVQLMGNVFADIEWKNKKFIHAFLYTEHGTTFWKNFSIIYEGKEYNTQLSETGKLDLKNVLPSTI